MRGGSPICQAVDLRRPRDDAASFVMLLKRGARDGDHSRATPGMNETVKKTLQHRGRTTVPNRKLHDQSLRGRQPLNISRPCFDRDRAASPRPTGQDRNLPPIEVQEIDVVPRAPHPPVPAFGSRRESGPITDDKRQTARAFLLQIPPVTISAGLNRPV